MKNWIMLLMLVALTQMACKKNEGGAAVPKAFRFLSLTVDGVNQGFSYAGTGLRPVIRIQFSTPVDEASVPAAITLSSTAQQNITFNTAFEDQQTTLVIQPASDLAGFTKYNFLIGNQLKSADQVALTTPVTVTLVTGMDSTDKFQRISDDALLTLVQEQTFKYFWDFGHPVSGLARERNTSGDLVTSGGSGFGIMAIITGINRNFITREEGLARLQKIVGFLKNDADRFHGAFPHWLNGATGATIPFSEKDNGADLVETSFLMQGLLTARQYFDGAQAGETQLRNDINELWREVEWDWFTKNGENVLYWHWSPQYEWQMNHPVQGWNEALITYVLAAASPDHTIDKIVYDNGWARNGAMVNGQSYYGIPLPLGPSLGGPLFFSHYSFLGIDPRGLQDAYANYQTQNTNHARINHQYSVVNPKGYAGYSSSVWGLTASDNQNGYSAHSPENDLGVIAPTAAISSMPYTPDQSMQALRFFYYKLGDRIWKEYGFVDAFNLNVPWFANSFLAIDQGPIIVMIENHRSGLLWDLFMSAPEIRSGLVKLGFSGPAL